jgi:hypothetical protein
MQHSEIKKASLHVQLKNRNKDVIHTQKLYSNTCILF